MMFIIVVQVEAQTKWAVGTRWIYDYTPNGAGTNFGYREIVVASVEELIEGTKQLILKEKHYNPGLETEKIIGIDTVLIVNNRVYYQKEQVNYLVYDFDSNVGDSVSVFRKDCVGNELQKLTQIIESIDGDTLRVKYYDELNSTYYSRNVIHQIGALTHLLNGFDALTSGGYCSFSLLCYSGENQTYRRSNTVWDSYFDNECGLIAGVNDLKLEKFNYQVLVDEDGIQLKIEKNMQCEVFLYSVQGKLLYNNFLAVNSSNVFMSVPENELFILKILYNNETYYKKIIR